MTHAWITGNRLLHLQSTIRLLALALTSAATLVACGSGNNNPTAEPEETRPQDSRTFTADATATTFPAMPAAVNDVTDMSTTSRWAGVLGSAGYRIEVPAAWNGKLVMYAHGFAGNGTVLRVINPSIRRHLIQNGYAWAASSYSKNFYDVRAGVEDTNALALRFTAIAAQNSRLLAIPTRLYITGHSMGGHITAAAIEDETSMTARNNVRYHGAIPMCGNVGDVELFNRFAAMQVTAQALAGVPDYPTAMWSDVKTLVTDMLFTIFPSTPTATGEKYLSVLKNLTGGTRPMFDLGMTIGGSFPSSYGTFSSDGTIAGILNKNVLDTNSFTYTIDGDAPESTALNASAQKLTAAADANRLRKNGLRWIPLINGEFKVPVVSIHTLGDLFVPFSMEQVYAKRAADKGNSTWLVQRAIRGVSHCDFTVAEQARAFDDMITWERDGIKPPGDDVMTPATVAAATYGCAFTNNTLGPDESQTTSTLRPLTLANSTPCP
jgi:hypothetical protein